MNEQARRAEAFRALHEGADPLLLPNPWDVGSARLLASLGFEALATTSLGAALASGHARVGREALLANCRELSAATPLPVNADLENGFGDAPEAAAEAIRDGAACGAVGGSIEDTPGEPDSGVYGFDHAVERVHAAVEAARALPFAFVVTARAENHLYGIDDLDDTIRRLQAFEAVGADVLYAPGLRSLAQMQQVVAAVERPVNVVMGFADPRITLADLRSIGVRRISIGGALCRVAMQSFMGAAKAMREGRFDWVADLEPVSGLTAALAP